MLKPIFHNIFYTVCLLFSYFLLPATLLAQSQKSGLNEITLLHKYADTANKTFNIKTPYYIAAWEKQVPPDVKIIRNLTGNMAVIELADATAFQVLKGKSNIFAANNNWKLSPTLEQTIHKKSEGKETYILTTQNIKALQEVLQKQPKEVVILSINEPSQSLIVKCKPAYVKDFLLLLNEVIFIDAATTAHPETGIIGYNRSFHGINAVDYRLPGANGKDIVASVKEQKINEADLDVWKRVRPSSIAAPTTSNHATVIASIIGGAGNSFYDGRGIAWGCTFYPSSFANLFADDAALLNNNNVSVQNHSYGTVIQQFYGAEAVSYDVHTWRQPHFVHVISAGNQGELFATEGRYATLPGYANLTGNFKMAKNIITVGAVDKNENVPPQSSAGPLYDGRLAPQLTALGPSGTSDAAAMVSGTVAVMQQVYADSNNRTLPSAALTKAVLFNTADDIYNKGIDYKTGYGLLNSFAAVKAIQQKLAMNGTVAPGGQWTKTISVPQNAAVLKITLAWTDSAATVNNNKALINDLDLEVTQLNTGTIYRPWVLSTSAHADSLQKEPIRKRDSLNTAEQVSITLPAAGDYTITVKGTDVSVTTLPFSIAYNIDTLNTFHFTSPLHASDVNRQEDENLYIRWRTFVKDSNERGSLYISYDGGTVWQLLQSVKLAQNKFRWAIKDTASTAILKMETPFGEFLSPAFIISPLTKLSVDFNCADSFRLSWNKHIYADAYRIYTLTDNPYLQPILTVNDTFAVFQRSVQPSLVYAVEPVLNNGLATARSIAVNINLQGVQCFYKTLNYNLLDANQLNLLLELSVATYADSIFFEKVTAGGTLLQTYGATAASNSRVTYNQLINDVPAGITYLRARIKLKSGATVYTDIIPVLTSGPKKILFYPNPVDRHTTLQYSLQQGIATSSKLQLFDAFGRLLKSYASMPGKINVSTFAPGLIIYKLLSADDQLLETGKLIIQ